MPAIKGASGSSVGKTYAVGFWDSELADNSLALFPVGSDFSWGVFAFETDGLDEDNYVEIKILNTTNSILKTFKFTTNGKHEIDLSQSSEIGSTQDIIIRVEITTFI